MNSGISNNGLSTLRATSQTFSSESFMLDKDGEMPEGAAPPQLNSPSVGISSPAPANPVRLTSFPEYEVPEDSPVEPIKVVRSKKKNPGRKKRTVTDST
jgi:AP-3 complex subunit delta-1